MHAETHRDVVAGQVAGGQLGLITRAQALRAGLTAGEIQRRSRTGRWPRLSSGVFAIAGTPPTWEQRVLAVVLGGGPGTVASHFTAAALHEFPDSVRAAVEITAPPGRQPRPRDAVVHRTIRLDAHDVTTVGGIPTTSYARTLVDCSGLMSLGQVARALDAGLIRRAVTLHSVERTLLGLRQTWGRHPSKLWTLLRERGGETALAESRPEMRVARVLRDAGLPTPAQQYWIRLGGSRFRLDFAYPEVKVAIEYDGWDTHRTRTSFDADRRRDRLLTLDGWIVLRFTSKTPDAELINSVRLCRTRSL